MFFHYDIISAVEAQREKLGVISQFPILDWQLRHGPGVKNPTLQAKSSSNQQFVSTCRSTGCAPPGPQCSLGRAGACGAALGPLCSGQAPTAPLFPLGWGSQQHTQDFSCSGPCVCLVPVEPLLLSYAQIIATRGSSGSKYTSMIVICFDILRILYNELSTCITSINLMRKPFMEQS